LLLASNDKPEELAEDLGHFALVAVDFPKFSDGRGFSIARLLRERYDYQGEIRAVGDVLRDQLLYMKRTGFDAYALREDQDLESSLSAFGDFSDAYQSTVDGPVPLFRRRLGGA
jgi:uncharacterized protein (DUF934 family)